MIKRVFSLLSLKSAVIFRNVFVSFCHKKADKNPPNLSIKFSVSGLFGTENFIACIA